MFLTDPLASMCSQNYKADFTQMDVLHSLYSLFQNQNVDSSTEFKQTCWLVLGAFGKETQGKKNVVLVLTDLT